MSLDVKDAVGVTKTLKTTLASGEHIPHHQIDGNVTVSGPLTDTQLRATAVKVDIAPLSLTQNIVALSNTVANGNRSALSSRPTRRFLLIQNLSDTAMNINFGADASSSTMLLPANGGGVEFSGPYVPTNEVRIFCTATPKAYYILEAYST